MDLPARDERALAVIARVRLLAWCCLLAGLLLGLLLLSTLPASLRFLVLIPLLGGGIIGWGGFIAAAGLQENLATAQSLRDAPPTPDEPDAIYPS